MEVLEEVPVLVVQQVLELHHKVLMVDQIMVVVEVLLKPVLLELHQEIEVGEMDYKMQ